MKVAVNADVCQGHTMCNMVAPEVFELRDEDGHAYVLRPVVDGEEAVAARIAALSCPEAAILLTEDALSQQMGRPVRTCPDVGDLLGTVETMEHSAFVVRTEPVPGREDEFNDWYDHQHIPDLLTVPGIVAVQRFRYHETQRPGREPLSRHRYVAVWEIEGDPVIALRGLDELIAAGIPISPAMAVDSLAHLWRPITNRIGSDSFR
jgi:ferredoxin